MKQIIYVDTLIIDDHQLLVGATAKGLCFVGSDNGSTTEIDKWYPTAEKIYAPLKVERYVLQLKEYYQGMRQNFDLPLDITGTDLQNAVWQELSHIPFGELKNYTDIAAALGKEKAVRAVASAVGANPCLIVIPCHRVVRKNGELSGYRGGILMKEELIKMEKDLLRLA